MQKEVNALRAPLLVLGVSCPSGTLWYPSGDPRLWSALPLGHPLVGVALRAPSGLLGYASIPMFQAKSRLRVEFQQTILKTRSGDTPPQVRDIRGGGAQDRQSVWFCTYGHPEFKFYAALRAASPLPRRRPEKTGS